MIRRLVLFALLLASPAWAADSTFIRAYDLNTPTIAATTNRIVTSVNLTNTTFTIANQPDVPRNITIAVTDTTPSVVAGTITVTGLDVNGNTITEVLDLSTGLTLTGTKVFASVSSVVSASATVLGGAGDETIIVGVGSVIAPIYCKVSGPSRGQGKVLTVSSSTTVTAASGTPFDLLDIGDELIVNNAGTFQRRVITAKASGTSVTVDSAVNWSGNSTTGYPFDYNDRVCGNSDSDGWHDVTGTSTALLFVDVLALSATGGIDYTIECRGNADSTQPRLLVAGNITTAVIPAVPSTTLDPIVVPEPCAALRIGLKFGTVDTSGTDSVSAYLRVR